MKQKLEQLLKEINEANAQTAHETNMTERSMNNAAMLPIIKERIEKIISEE